MNRKYYQSNRNWTKLLTRLSLILAGLIMINSPVQADPPRVLHTSFDEYARQQQQHDQQLAQGQQSSTGHKATKNANSTMLKNASASSKTNTASTASKKSGSQKSSTPININTADEASLSNTLIGVGPAKAKAIVAYRQQNGTFKQPEDLLAVKGIGPATLEKNRDRIRVN